MSNPAHDSRRTPILGCVADDVTGATDLAINLVQGGLSVIQIMGVPTSEELDQIDADAIVVALKTRSIPAADAIEQSLTSLEALRHIGIDRFFFKYCSTFDSTEQGNIGPVAEAMMDALGVEQTIFCPALPRNGRTVYQGHLFVNGRLLNESGMENHPLNPMTDPDLVRFLGIQTSQKVGLLSYAAFEAGGDRVTQELQALAESGVNLVITDSCDDEQLSTLAQAVADMRLVTGGSGIARYLPEAYRKIGLLESPPDQPRLPEVAGRSLILSGSCSAATNQQVNWMKQRCPAWKIDVPAIIDDSSQALGDVLSWAKQTDPAEPVLVYSTAAPDEVSQLQDQFGRDAVAHVIEDFHASIAAAMVADLGVRRLVLAGGETSGAVTTRLGVRALRIGPEISAGVPWTISIGETPLALALKSGNFGGEDFFESALETLP
jgi:uncharacterized protein YgbK (DUF1537 family)